MTYLMFNIAKLGQLDVRNGDRMTRVIMRRLLSLLLPYIANFILFLYFKATF